MASRLSARRIRPVQSTNRPFFIKLYINGPVPGNPSVESIYDRDDKIFEIKEILNRYFELYLRANTNEKLSLLDNLAKQIMLLASYFKHPSFEEEKERRIVIINKSDKNGILHFREGKYSLVPYIQVPIKREFIKIIYIGPTVNKDLAKKSLEIFIKNEYELASQPEILLSDSPYRP